MYLDYTCDFLMIEDQISALTMILEENYYHLLTLFNLRIIDVKLPSFPNRTLFLNIEKSLILKFRTPVVTVVLYKNISFACVFKEMHSLLMKQVKLFLGQRAGSCSFYFQRLLFHLLLQIPLIRLIHTILTIEASTLNCTSLLQNMNVDYQFSAVGILAPSEMSVTNLGRQFINFVMCLSQIIGPYSNIVPKINHLTYQNVISCYQPEVNIT